MNYAMIFTGITFYYFLRYLYYSFSVDFSSYFQTM